MVVTEKRVNTAQLFTVIFILGMSLKMLMLPVLLLKTSGRDAVLGMTGVLISELVCLVAMLFALALAPEKKFAELLEGCIGKWATKILCVPFALFFVFKLLLLSGEVRIFFSENLFTEFSWSFYALPLFGLCIVLGKGTLRALGRTAQFLFPFIAAATVLMFVLVGQLDYSELLPLGEYGVSGLVPDVFRHAMWYGDYSALLIFFGSVKRTKAATAIGIGSGAIASAVVLFFTLGLTASFSSVADLVRFGQNITGMSHYALGNVMQGRFDLILFCVWLFSAFVKAGVFAYAAVYLLRVAFPVGKTPCALGVGVVLYVGTLIWSSATAMHTFFMAYCAVPAFVMQFLVPVLALVSACMIRAKENKKGNRAKTAAQTGENENAS